MPCKRIPRTANTLGHTTQKQAPSRRSGLLHLEAKLKLIGYLRVSSDTQLD